MNLGPLGSRLTLSGTKLEVTFFQLTDFYAGASPLFYFCWFFSDFMSSSFSTRFSFSSYSWSFRSVVESYASASLASLTASESPFRFLSIAASGKVTP